MPGRATWYLTRSERVARIERSEIRDQSIRIVRISHSLNPGYLLRAMRADETSPGAYPASVQVLVANRVCLGHRSIAPFLP